MMTTTSGPGPPPKVPRPPNPNCATCTHPGSFHPKRPGSRKRACKAFGCQCVAYVSVAA